MLDLPMSDLNTYVAAQKSTHYLFIVPTGVPLSAVMHADYWVHVRRRMKEYDIIEVVSQDGTYEARFRITFINHITGMMKFRLLSEWHPEGQAEPIVPAANSRFEAKWIVGKRSFCVYEKVTGNMVAEGFSSKEEAEAEALRLDGERKAA